MKIKFLGDSFVWGQGLDWYDYGFPNSWMFHMDIQDYDVLKKAHGGLDNIFKYPYEKVDSDDIRVKRYYNMIQHRFSTKVAKHFNATCYQRFANGGSPSDSIKLLNTDLDEDVVIFLISDYRRDQWGHHLDSKPEYLSKLSQDSFTKLILIDIIDELRLKAQKTGHKQLATYYRDDLIRLLDKNDIWDLQKDWYKVLFEYLKDWVEKNKKEIYFLGSWLNDGKNLMDCDEPEIQWYKDRVIPFNYNDKTYYSFYEIQGECKGMRIDNTLSINRDDDHPSLELNNIVAENIINFLEEKLNDKKNN